MDSIGLSASPPGCQAELIRTVIPADGLPDGPAGSLTLDLPGPAVPAPPVTAAGEMCSAGDDPFFGSMDISLAMRIDSVRGELVYGRWGVYYWHSSVGPDGMFHGIQRDGLLVLSLLPNELSTRWCTELRLALPIGPGGEWGRAGVLFDDGCLPEGVDLLFKPTPQAMFPS